MNEVALHQGSSPHLSANGTIFVDGQHLTEAVANTAIGKIVPVVADLRFMVMLPVSE